MFDIFAQLDQSWNRFLLEHMLTRATTLVQHPSTSTLSYPLPLYFHQYLASLLSTCDATSTSSFLTCLQPDVISVWLELILRTFNNTHVITTRGTQSSPSTMMIPCVTIISHILHCITKVYHVHNPSAHVVCMCACN